MPTNVATQFKETGNVSFRASAAVTGKRFLAISGDRTGGPGLSTDLENLYRMAHAPAAGPTVGVAKYDVPINETGGVHGQPGMIVPVTAGAAIAAGQRVEVGANGQAVPLAVAPATPGVPVGIAMSGVAIGADAQIKLA